MRIACNDAYRGQECTCQERWARGLLLVRRPVVAEGDSAVTSTTPPLCGVVLGDAHTLPQ